MNNPGYEIIAACGYCSETRVQTDEDVITSETIMRKMVYHHRLTHDYKDEPISFKVEIKEKKKKRKLVVYCAECDKEFYLNLNAEAIENHYEMDHSDITPHNYFTYSRLV